MRILIVSTDWSGLISPIIDEIKRQGHEVDYLDHSVLSDFKYFNKIDRIQSKAFNFLSNKKYKHLRTEEQIEFSLRGFLHCKDKYDLAIFTNPDIFNDVHFSLFRKGARKLILNLWDSLERMPNNKQKIKFFDIVRSFDPIDCGNFGFIPTTNYFHRNEQIMDDKENYKYDTFSIMTFCKERYPLVDRFINANPNVNHKIMIYIDNERKRKYIKNEKIDVITKPILNDKLRAIISESKSVLDIGYRCQNGFSFRVFETLAWNKKLITTNPHITNADFYDENNILLLSDDFLIDDCFLNSSYSPVPDDIKKKYRLDFWVKNLLMLDRD